MAKRRKKPAPRDDNKKTLPQLRRKLWPLISKYIREKYQNEDGSTTCYTCRRNIPKGGKVDAGHFLPKRLYKAHYYNVDAIRPQCFRCNGPGQGEQLLFYFHLADEIGAEAVSWIRSHKDDGWPEDKPWYIDMIRRYS